VCIHDFLGHVIRYKYYEKDSKDMKDWERPQQAFGWDRPEMKHARLLKQKGFFVYPVDVTRTLGEVLEEWKTEDGKEEERKDSYIEYRINRQLLPYIRGQLKEKHLERWIVYLNVECSFKKLEARAISSAAPGRRGAS
jgi:hypothetical protein